MEIYKPFVMTKFNIYEAFFELPAIFTHMQKLQYIFTLLVPQQTFAKFHRPKLWLTTHCSDNQEFFLIHLFDLAVLVEKSTKVVI